MPLGHVLSPGKWEALTVENLGEKVTGRESTREGDELEDFQPQLEVHP